MKTIHIQDAATVEDLLGLAQKEPVLLHERTGRAFVLVEVDRDDAETLALAGNANLERILDRSRVRARCEGWLTTQQLRQELGTE